MPDNTIFIFSEDDAVRESLSSIVAATGLNAEALSSLDAWLQAHCPGSAGCLVLDVAGGGLAEPEALAKIAAACARMPVLVLAERGDIPTAVHAIRQGAACVLQKPFSDKNLRDHIVQAVTKKANGHAIC